MNWMYVLDAFSDTVMPAVALSAGIRYKSFKNKNFRIIILFLGLAFITFAVSNYLANKGINNLFLYNAFGVFESTIVFGYFYPFIKSRIFRALSLASVSAYLIIIIYEIIFIKIVLSNFTIIIFLSSVIIASISLLYLLDSMIETKESEKNQLSNFWFSIAWLFFGLGTVSISFFYLVFSKVIFQEQQDTWVLVNTFLIVKYCLLIVGLIKADSKKNQIPLHTIH